MCQTEAEAKAARKAAKRAAKEVEAAVVEEVAVDEEAEKAARKAAKRAAKEAAAAPAEVEVAEAPVVDEAEAKAARKAAKRAAKEAAPAVEATAEVTAEDPPAKKAKVEEPEEAKPVEAEAPAVADENEFKVFVGGLPFSATEETINKDFAECGEIVAFKLPLNEEWRPRGIAFITYTSQEAVDAALKFDGTEYGGRTLQVKKAEGGKGKGKDGKGKDGKGKDGKGKDGKGKGKEGKEGKGAHDNTNTVFVRGLPFSVEEETMKKDFLECGEIESFRLPMNEEGNPKGIAFIKYSSKEGMDAALKFDSTDYGGRTIYVSDAGADSGKAKGKGKDGKDGKGKGKDGKGKGKGKKGGLSVEQNAAKNGAMVESTGEKKTFDSDDE